MPIRKIHTCIVSALLAGTCCAFWIAGCASVSPGSDPLVVRTEQGETLAYDTFDEFLKLDDQFAGNPVTSNAWNGAHSFAVYLRQPVPNGTNTVPFGVGSILSVDQIKNAYKAGTASSNALVTAVATLSATVGQAQNYESVTNTFK